MRSGFVLTQDNLYNEETYQQKIEFVDNIYVKIVDDLLKTVKIGGKIPIEPSSFYLYQKYIKLLKMSPSERAEYINKVNNPPLPPPQVFFSPDHFIQRHNNIIIDNLDNCQIGYSLFKVYENDPEIGEKFLVENVYDAMRIIFKIIDAYKKNGKSDTPINHIHFSGYMAFITSNAKPISEI